jgi:lipoprotein-anchoring transpeptidase ErfK/SrfK
MVYRSLKFIATLVAVGLLAGPGMAQEAELIDLAAFGLPQPQVPDLPAPEFPVEPSDALMPLRLQITLSRRQVTLYRGDQVVKRYAIAVGKPGWETPTGTFQVRQMIKDPAWVHPLQKGVLIPAGDPENPLGRFWIGFWTDGKNWIGFHGTPNPKSVGTPASHGCIRMYNQDIEDLFQRVKMGTEVTVVP